MQVYRSLDRSGVLDALLASGKEIALISNIDNLGATVDMAILHHLVAHDVGFAMEVRSKCAGASATRSMMPRTVECGDEGMEDQRVYAGVAHA